MAPGLMYGKIRAKVVDFSNPIDGFQALVQLDL